MIVLTLSRMYMDFNQFPQPLQQRASDPIERYPHEESQGSPDSTDNRVEVIQDVLLLEVDL